MAELTWYIYNHRISCLITSEIYNNENMLVYILLKITNSVHFLMHIKDFWGYKIIHFFFSFRAEHYSPALIMSMYSFNFACPLIFWNNFQIETFYLLLFWHQNSTFSPKMFHTCFGIYRIVRETTELISEHKISSIIFLSNR